MKKFLKEKLKNKFILVIIIIIISILGFQGYQASILTNIDTNTYVVSIKGKIKINNYLLKKDERKKLAVKDKIITSKDSACVIEWGDGSLTRLGENSKVEIQELNVKKDLSRINLQFKLINGKTWSNVVSFLGEESYFKQNFKDKNDKDIEAAVRGTIFDVNLPKDYVYVTNHEVMLQKGELKTNIEQNQAFSISNFSFIEIKKFINKIQDKTWQEINSNLDKKFLNNLSKNVSAKFEGKDINNFINANKTYNELLTEYQKLNFVPASDTKLFAIKNTIKKQLISKADKKNKENLVKYSIFDFKDALDSKNINSIQESFSILSENPDIVKNLNSNFTKDIFNNMNQYGNKINKFIGDKASDLKNIFGNNFKDIDYSKYNLDENKK